MDKKRHAIIAIVLFLSPYVATDATAQAEESLAGNALLDTA